MKYTTLIAIAALVSGTSAVKLQSAFAPPASGPYASDTDHLSSECYGADEDDIMYDVATICGYCHENTRRQRAVD